MKTITLTYTDTDSKGNERERKHVYTVFDSSLTRIMSIAIMDDEHFKLTKEEDNT